MRIRLTLVGLIFLAAVGGILFFHVHSVTEKRAQVASLRSEVQRTSQQLDEANASRQRLISEKSELLRQATEHAPAPSVGPQLGSNAPGSGASATGGIEKSGGEKAMFGKFLAKMMDDPETKRFLRDQQGQMMGQLYAPLIKSLALSPEQAEKLKTLIVDNAMKSTERVSSFMSSKDNLSGDPKSGALGSILADQRQFDDQVKDLLGESNYAQFKEYQMTVPERMQLNIFRQQAGLGDRALSDGQVEQLLQVMHEEKQAVAAEGYATPAPGAGFASGTGVLSAEQTDKVLQTQELVDQRVQERVRALLTPEQFQAFATFQTNQLQTMRMGMSIARKVFEPGSPAP